MIRYKVDAIFDLPPDHTGIRSCQAFVDDVEEVGQSLEELAQSFDGNLLKYSVERVEIAEEPLTPDDLVDPEFGPVTYGE